MMWKLIFNPPFQEVGGGAVCKGLVGAGRRRQLVQLRQQQDINIICLQETLKQSFTPSELDRFSRDLDFH